MTAFRTPTKSEAMATLEILNTTGEVVGNAYALYSVESKTNYPTKKKIVHVDNNKMAKRVSYFRRFLSFFDELCLLREQQLEQRRRRSADRLEQRRLKTEAEVDARKEERMVHSLGFVRCGKCKAYTSPNAMLELIANAMVKDLEERKEPYNRDEVRLIHAVVINKGARKPRLPAELDRYKHSFLRMETCCQGCKCKHGMEYSAELVCKLQESCIKLVYENMAIIQFEHDVVA
jgi:hypothetical protein